MAEPISLLPIRASAIAIGVPLSQTLYDWHGNVLLAAGSIIQTQEQFDKVLENGFFQDLSWNIASSKPPAAAVAGTPAASSSSPAAPAPAKEVVVNMDDVHWYVGEAMTLQPHDKPTLRYAVQLIGFVKNRTVFVTAPALEGKIELIRDGQTFVVRAFSGKKAFAFTAVALKSLHSPHPYLILSYPKEVRCTVIRQSARVEVGIIASVSLGQPERVGAARLTDLSMGGASATSKEPLGRKGEEGRIKFKVNAADIDSYLNVKVALRSVTEAEAGSGFKYGFEFIDLPVHDRLILSAFVHQTLVETN